MDAYQKINNWIPSFLDDYKTDDDDTTSDDDYDTLPRILPLFPIQLTNTTGTYLDDLNEDCLLEIFASNSLTTMDLCSLAETCTRFKQIIERVFPKDYGIARGYREYNKYEFQWKSRKECYANLQGAERILKNFGSHLTKLEIGWRDQDLVNVVGMYCGDATLNHLRIVCWNCVIHAHVGIEGAEMHMNSIFQRLRQLHFCSCHFHGDVTFQNLNYDSLIELEIRHSSDCVVILKQNFPKLERFSWHCSNVYRGKSNSASHILYEFIRRHGNLKTILVRDESVCKSGLLHVIESTCKELENFKLNLSSNYRHSVDFPTLVSLPRLKMLDLGFVSEDKSTVIALLQAAKSLETIKLTSWCRFSLIMFDVLSQLQNLRELHLSAHRFSYIPWDLLLRLKQVYLKGVDEELNVAGQLDIIRQLINLEELEYHLDCSDDDVSFGKSFYLRQEDFTEIVKIVERREHVLTFKCYFNFKLEENCNENQKVKLIKQNRVSYYVSDEN